MGATKVHHLAPTLARVKFDLIHHAVKVKNGRFFVFSSPVIQRQTTYVARGFKVSVMDNFPHSWEFSRGDSYAKTFVLAL